MSRIDDAFRKSRIEFGLKQKPNWLGTVYGSCQTKGCQVHRKVAYHSGGFCKTCSTRHREDSALPVLVTIKRAGSKVDIPNPKIRWTNKTWVKDMTHTMTAIQRTKFYKKPDPYG